MCVLCVWIAFFMWVRIQVALFCWVVHDVSDTASFWFLLLNAGRSINLQTNIWHCTYVALWTYFSFILLFVFIFVIGKKLNRYICTVSSSFLFFFDESDRKSISIYFNQLFTIDSSLFFQFSIIVVLLFIYWISIALYCRYWLLHYEALISPCRSSNHSSRT